MRFYLAPPSPRGSLLAVRTPEQLDHYLRESELITGHARRTFVIVGADRLRYQIHWIAQGCRIDRLDDQGNVVNTAVVACDEFLAHPLIDALRYGQLYTPPAHH
ncbi:hypothetical protein LDO26_00800 [Luteimonas sp. BDR2-5]|uniref:hypothetical protein n=1 Tax=Proluteimonas luteida TaxID=2878685 RepID=UPI001E3687C8|nr:hypothetical protein [Luteimonas sp. BDR2-5]MCD9026753.1 hypothetical protein [Luteimonas sp. BDR2-5]